MSFSTVKSAAMEGLAVEMVYVEADVSDGMPLFEMSAMDFRFFTWWDICHQR